MTTSPELIKGSSIVVLRVVSVAEFDRADQMTLFAFQETCLRFDAAIVGALNSGGEGNAQLVKDIMGFLFMVGKIVIPLIIL